ncbi:chemotaxis-specific protein-glutamate methyltransferase CheB [Roseococcus sp. YIM B11640]|uniref:chemotaxis-specific protein-glutamate methyltransferase CheB n=1 Tax=Roseococcus sp. YIM B11640 TaxID=3133973 RepID=UPI003C7C6D20
MIKLLIADDSALMRRVLGDIFREAGGFEIALARDGVEALERLHAFHPDVVTLDVQMPRMNGLECLDRIMIERPTPVVMVSSLTSDGADAALEALDLGAVDIVAKPGGTITLALHELAPALLEKVRAAALSRVRRSHRLAERLRARRPSLPAPRPPAPGPQPPRNPATGRPLDMVIIGTSTGGPPALEKVLGKLPADFPCPVLVAQHMPATFTASLAQRLDGLCALRVTHVDRPTPVAPGSVYMARGDADMIVSLRADGPVVLPTPSSAEHRWHPSVDRLVSSALAHLPAERLAGVLMTGMGNDGATAMTALRAAGGATIAEAEETAVVWGMPGELVRAGGADYVLPLEDIARQLVQIVTPS